MEVLKDDESESNQTFVLFLLSDGRCVLIGGDVEISAAERRS
jgi:hypothetical protein